jgi:hypothetical protein
MFGRMRLHDPAVIRRLTSYLAAAALVSGAGCTFQPGGLVGGPGIDGGASPDATEASPDATEASPDARVVDAGRMSDAKVPLDAARDAAGPIEPIGGLVAHWPLDIIEGTTTRTTPDVVGGFDGEVRGTATIVPGTIDGAISLNGISEFVRIANPPELDFAGVITLAAWCRPGPSMASASS